MISTTAPVDRPKGLVLTAALLCVFNIAGVIQYDPGLMSFGTFLAFYIPIAALSFLVIRFYWLGRNWTRWLTLSVSVLALFNLVLLGSLTAAQRTFAVAEAVFAGWLLWWLNTKRVRQYFHRPVPGDSPKAASGGVLKKVALGCGIVVASGVALLFVAILLSGIYSPTPRPVYDTEISEAHRRNLQGMIPAGEPVVGLFSTGVFRLTEEGCLFTTKRVIRYESGKVVDEAVFKEIERVELVRDRSFWGMSELTVVRKDGSRFFLKLPNARAYPDDADRFHERLLKEWRKGR